MNQDWYLNSAHRATNGILNHLKSKGSVGTTTPFAFFKARCDLPGEGILSSALEPGPF